MNCPDCGRPMRRDDTLPGFMCDTPKCANSVRAGGRGGVGAWRDPLVRWLYNSMDPAPPPPDADEWVAIARKRFGPMIILEFVWREDARWWVAKADLAPVGAPPRPPDVRLELTVALRTAGKPVVD